MEELDSTYLEHVTAESGSGKDILKTILNFRKESFINEKAIKAFGCYGTASSTVVYNEAVLLFENALKHPVQVVVTLLHLNELLLRKVMVYLHGPTSGPSSSGPIGKCLANCQDLTVVNYNKIYSTFLDVDFKDLSTNQK